VNAQAINSVLQYMSILSLSSIQYLDSQVQIFKTSNVDFHSSVASCRHKNSSCPSFIFFHSESHREFACPADANKSSHLRGHTIHDLEIFSYRRRIGLAR
jgi:hypothetical protein